MKQSTKDMTIGRRFEQYPEFKDSETDWLGIIPQEWETRRLKHLLATKITDGPHATPEFLPEGIPFLSVDGIQDGELVFEGCRYVAEEDHNQFKKKALPKRDDILLGKAASTGKIARVKIDCEFSIWSPLALIRIDSDKASSHFIEYALKGPEVQSQIDMLCTANTQKNISMDDIPRLCIPCPPLDEQRAIAEFLDRETAKIDALVAKKRRLIELLEEKRTALISHAVTKGLDPNVTMKDSAIEWYGKIPRDWTVTVAKRVARVFVPERSKPELNANGEGLPWITPEDIGQREVSGQTAYCWVSDVAACETGSRSVVNGSVLASCVGNFGVASVNKGPCIVNQQIQAYIPTRIDAYYLRFLVNLSVPYFCQVSTAATVSYVNSEGFGEMPVLLPPIPEQERIVDSVDRKMTKVDGLTSHIHLAIERLNEYRTALISAAVTGKIDVRNA